MAVCYCNKIDQKKKLITFVCLFLLVIIASGCKSSVGQIREKSPTKVKAYKVNYEDLANCSLDKMDEAWHGENHIRVNKNNEHARIITHSNYLGCAICDFSFKQKGNKTVVESRGRMENFQQDYYTSKIWPLVDECSTLLTNNKSLDKKKNNLVFSVEEIEEYLVIGKTTKFDVEYKLGKPSEKEGPSKSYEYWGYYYENLPVKLSLQFNENGVLNDYRNKDL